MLKHNEEKNITKYLRGDSEIVRRILSISPSTRNIFLSGNLFINGLTLENDTLNIVAISERDRSYHRLPEYYLYNDTKIITTYISWNKILSPITLQNVKDEEYELINTLDLYNISNETYITKDEGFNFIVSNKNEILKCVLYKLAKIFKSGTASLLINQYLYKIYYYYSKVNNLSIDIDFLNILYNTPFNQEYKSNIDNFLEDFVKWADEISNSIKVSFNFLTKNLIKKDINKVSREFVYTFNRRSLFLDSFDEYEEFKTYDNEFKLYLGKYRNLITLLLPNEIGYDSNGRKYENAICEYISVYDENGLPKNISSQINAEKKSFETNLYTIENTETKEKRTYQYALEARKNHKKIALDVHLINDKNEEIPVYYHGNTLAANKYTVDENISILTDIKKDSFQNSVLVMSTRKCDVEPFFPESLSTKYSYTDIEKYKALYNELDYIETEYVLYMNYTSSIVSNIDNRFIENFNSYKASVVCLPSEWYYQENDEYGLSDKVFFGKTKDVKLLIKEYIDNAENYKSFVGFIIDAKMKNKNRIKADTERMLFDYQSFLSNPQYINNKKAEDYSSYTINFKRC